MAGFEVYFGNAGVWERVVLEGSGVINETIIKTASDSLRATILEAGSIMPVLRKTASDTLRPTITESSNLIASGDTIRAGADSIRATLTETARVAVFMTRTDTLTPRITETIGILKGGEGVSRTYGSGIYGSGAYGTSTSGEITTTVPVTVNDNVVGSGELQHNFSAGWTVGTGSGNYQSGDRYSKVVGTTWNYYFKGTRLRLYGAKASHHGIGSMVVDDRTAVDVDYYSSVRQDQVQVFDTGTLPNGDHYLTLTVTGRRNPSATDSVITVDYVNVDSSGLNAAPQPAAEPVGQALWGSDLTKTLPSAFEFTWIDNGYSNLGSIISTPEGPAFRSRVPANVNGVDGYRGQTELPLKASGFPRKSVRMSSYFRMTKIGGHQVTDTKIGYGLAGIPAGGGGSAMSGGGLMYDNSWSVRTTSVPANYMFSGQPWSLSCYIYAYFAGGQTYQKYGLRSFYKNPDGSHFVPVEGRRYKKDEEVVVNTPGLKDGRYTVWIDDVMVLNLTDVMWNKSGFDIPFSHFISQTYSNENITSEFVYDQWGVTLSDIDDSSTRTVVNQDFSLMTAQENYLVNGENIGTPWYVEPGSTNVHIRSGYMVNTYDDYHRIWTRERVGGPGKSVICTVRSSATDIDNITVNRSRSGLKWGVNIPPPSHPTPDDPESGDADFSHGDTASLQVFTSQTYEGYIEMSQQVFGGGYRFPWDYGGTTAKVGYTPGTEQEHKIQVDWLEGNLSTKVGKVRARVWRNGTLIYDTTDPASPLWGYSGFWRQRGDFCTWKIRSVKIEEVAH